MGSVRICWCQKDNYIWSTNRADLCAAGVFLHGESNRRLSCLSKSGWGPWSIMIVFCPFYICWCAKQLVQVVESPDWRCSAASSSTSAAPFFRNRCTKYYQFIQFRLVLWNNGNEYIVLTGVLLKILDWLPQQLVSFVVPCGAYFPFSCLSLWIHALQPNAQISTDSHISVPVHTLPWICASALLLCCVSSIAACSLRFEPESISHGCSQQNLRLDSIIIQLIADFRIQICNCTLAGLEQFFTPIDPKNSIYFDT